jgi:multimeric flavodoxin WrbA
VASRGEKIFASAIVIFASPTWLGKILSVAQRALERMDAMLSEQNEQGKMFAYNRVAGFADTGNEDGAKNCISELASAAVELGFCVPLLWH